MKTGTVVKALTGIIVIGGGVGYFMYQTMQSSWAYYYSVDDFSTTSPAVQEHSFRLAGRVKTGSVERDLENVTLRFTLAGAESELPVQYEGVVPDNFVENVARNRGLNLSVFTDFDEAVTWLTESEFEIPPGH